MKCCPLCGRKYVKEELVVLPPTKEEVLTEWRAKRRAAKSAAAALATAETTETATPAETVIPAARASRDDAEDAGAIEAVSDSESTTWTHAPIELAPKLLSVGAIAMFVSAFALGESVMALNLIG
ncbi:MAG: hypothetical protein JWO22_1454 [Frankiales bacterium]|nr:hypothetical protein [Frankiales bacterium]